MAHPLLMNRCMVIATMHQKEKIIEPLLKSALNTSVVVPEDLDTDIFGTFSGEIERISDPLTTARNKCMAALEKTGLDLAVASEGSFGPHPMIPFIHADTELLLLVDRKNNIEIQAVEISSETNFNSMEFHSYLELKEFAQKVSFPSHALILKAAGSPAQIVKGIKDWKTLEVEYDKLKTVHERLIAETDMRAMNNPTRMKVIENATHRLIEKIRQHCPSCAYPGYSVTKIISGLPCENCGMPTRTARFFINECTYCNHTTEKEFPEGKQSEDPMYCNFCNP